MSSNPYQPFFEKLDATVKHLADNPSGVNEADGRAIDDAVDLLRRMGFVLANHINNQAHYLQMLILDPEPAGTGDDTSGTPPAGTEEG